VQIHRIEVSGLESKWFTHLIIPDSVRIVF